MPTHPEISVVTPVYLDRPERVRYLTITLASFYRCCRYPGIIVHTLVDDRSPAHAEELRELCNAFGIRQIPRIEDATRRGFQDVYQRLLATVGTEFFVYLEPDHYFYLPCDFISVALKLFEKCGDLVGVYLRAPMTYSKFRREHSPEGDFLSTFDGTKLERVVIDAENTGWLGCGRQHEGFTLMPAIWRSAPVREYFRTRSPEAAETTPYDFEIWVDSDWNGSRRTGYLNAQAFSYHIGGGGMGGGYSRPRNLRYEVVWARKIL